MERDSRIKEAWLDNTGTKLAVIGPENSTGDTRFKAVKSVFAPSQTKPQELKGQKREAALKQFQSGKDWFRAAGLDQLSRQESRIIAARLIGRLRTKVPLSDEKARTLETGFAAIFERCFTREPMALDQRNKELLKLARQHLDEKGIEVLKEALTCGIQPLANEK